MNKINLFYASALVLQGLFLQPLLSASESSPNETTSLSLQRLGINRTILARYESERSRLLETKSKKELVALEYKIKALREDQLRVMASLPERVQAYELMKDMLTFKDDHITIKKNISPVISLHEKALSFVGQNNLSDAIKIYEQIVLADSNDDQAYLIMGHCHLLLGHIHSAEIAYHNAVAIDTDNRSEIVPFFENITLQNPSDDEAYSNLGYANLILGEFEKARDAFKDALQINPSNMSAAK